MPKDSIRISLNAAQFPPLYRDMPRTVIIPAMDVNVKWPSYFGNQDNADWGSPQVIFCENVLPIANGYVSVQYLPQDSADTPSGMTSTSWPITGTGPVTISNTFTLFIAIGGYRVIKTGGAGAWDSQVSTLSASIGNASITFTPNLGNRNFAMGISADPNIGTNVADIDYAIQCTAAGTVHVWEFGVDLGVFGAGYIAGSIFKIIYSGTTIQYLQNNVAFRTITVAANLTFYLDSAFFDPGADVYGILFNPTSTYDRVIILKDAKETPAILIPGGGLNAILIPSAIGGSWFKLQQFTASGQIVSFAYVNGRFFVFYEKQLLLEYASATTSMTDVSASLVFPAGFDITMVRGIGTASNYMLLFTDITVLWSSPADPLNFNRALNNGSGFQIPQDVASQITCIKQISGGAIIYTLRNAVAMTFTNNAAAPFVFRGIPNSGGVLTERQVAAEGVDAAHYSWGTGGMQRVNLQIAVTIMPELADFLTANWYETYDYVNHQVVGAQAGSYFSVKLTYVGQRYLIVSYGLNADTYTYALVYDTLSERWGKLRINHVDVFTYPYPKNNSAGTGWRYADIPSDYTAYDNLRILDLFTTLPSAAVESKKTIAFLAADGSTSIVATDYNASSNQIGQKSVVIIGRIQEDRNHMTTLHQIEVEGIDGTEQAPRIFDLYSIDGKQISGIAEYLAYDVTPDATYNNYLGTTTAKTHQLAFEGDFQLTSLLVQLAKHGRAV